MYDKSARMVVKNYGAVTPYLQFLFYIYDAILCINKNNTYSVFKSVNKHCLSQCKVCNKSKIIINAFQKPAIMNNLRDIAWIYISMLGIIITVINLFPSQIVRSRWWAKLFRNHGMFNDQIPIIIMHAHLSAVISLSDTTILPGFASVPSLMSNVNSCFWLIFFLLRKRVKKCFLWKWSLIFLSFYVI